MHVIQVVVDQVCYLMMVQYQYVRKNKHRFWWKDLDLKKYILLINMLNVWYLVLLQIHKNYQKVQEVKHIIIDSYINNLLILNHLHKVLLILHLILVKVISLLNKNLLLDLMVYHFFLVVLIVMDLLYIKPILLVLQLVILLLVLVVLRKVYNNYLINIIKKTCLKEMH